MRSVHPYPRRRRPRLFTARAICRYFLFFPAIALIFVSVLPAFADLETEPIPGKPITRWTPQGSVTEPAQAVSGQVLIRVKPGTSPADLEEALSRRSANVLMALDRIGTYLVSLPEDMSVSEGVEKWQGETCVEIADPDRLMYPMRVPNDPRYAEQYQWPLIDAPLAWDVETGSSETIVAVVDSGIDLDHEDLQGKLWQNADDPVDGTDNDGNGYVDDWIGWDTYENDNDPEPHPTDPIMEFGASHGSHCAGLVGAVTDNATGVAGTDWNCQLMTVKVFPEAGGAPSSVIMDGFMYAADNGADVISLSLGGGYTPVWDQPIAYAHQNGIVVVAAAGNEDHEFTDDQSTWYSPVCNDGPMFTDNFVIGVAATDENDIRASFSNYDGSVYNFVDVAAPGVDILSCLIYDPSVGFNQPYGLMSGTSMSTPIVAGVAALVKASMPGASVDDIVQQIRLTTDNIDDKNPAYVGMLGTGRVNAAGAIGDMAPRLPDTISAFDTQDDEGGSVTVLWGKSPDDGSGFNDVTGYDILRSTQSDGSFTKIQSMLAPGTTLHMDTDVEDEQEYYYKLAVHDAVNVSVSEAVGPAIPIDDKPPPPIENLYARDTMADDGGSISLNWSGYSPVEDVQGYRIYRSETSFSSLEDEGPAAVYTVPGKTATLYRDEGNDTYPAPVNGTEYWYAVVPIDEYENEDAAVTVVGPVVPSPNYTFNYPAGLSLMSIGADTPKRDLAELLGVDAAQLQAARYDPATETYHQYDPDRSSAFMEHRLGRAFWLAAPSTLVRSIAGEAVPEQQRYYSITFAPGWNMIGNPFTGAVDTSAARVVVGTTTMSLSEAAQSGYVLDYMWTYDAFLNSYRLLSPSIQQTWARQTLGKGHGFFFRAFTSGELRLPNPAYVANGAGGSQAEAAQSEAAYASADWKLRLMAETNGFADTDNFAGVSEAAEQLNDMRSPPPQGIDLYFEANDGVRTAASFADAATNDMSSRFHVEVAQAGPVTIRWPDLSEVPRDIKPMLVDVVTGERVYMRTVSEYSYDADAAGTREFTLDLQSLGRGALLVEAMATHATDSAVQIAFTLSADATVQVEVFNIAGRHIATVRPSVQVHAGEPTTLSWNRTTAQGTNAPTGRYVIRMTAATEDGQKASAARAVTIGR